MTKRPYRKRTPDPAIAALLIQAKAKCPACGTGAPLVADGGWTLHKARRGLIQCAAIEERRHARELAKAGRLK